MRSARLAYVVALCAMLACGGGNKPEVESASSKNDDETLYQRIGGIDILRGLVDAWMFEVASDPRIRDFFVDADVARVKLRMVERLCVLVDGPCMYRGSELREHHAGLSIEGHHMRAFLEDLDPAMKRVDISGDVAKELREALSLLGAQIGAEIGE